MSQRKSSSQSNLDKWYTITLLLLVILAIVTATAFKLIYRQRNELDSLRFRLDLLYSKLGITEEVTTPEVEAD